MRQSKNTNATNPVWLARAIQGDPEAFGDLYEFYLDEIQRYIYYSVGDRHEAEDLTETVFLKAWEALPRFETSRVNLRAWLYRIAHNTVVDHYRTRKPTADALAEQMHDGKPSPEHIVQMRDRSDQLVKAIGGLDDRMKQVIICRFVNDLSHAETAEVIGVQEGHVRVLQHRALLLLRTYLEND